MTEPSYCCNTCYEKSVARDMFADMFGRRMILCPTCGNKRCPKATDHGNTCTNSNEPGQVGSNY